jgi:hypothetical protein
MNKEKEKNEEFEGKKPDYSSSGVAVWINKGEKGEYLTIKIVGHNNFIAFKNK